MFEHGGDPKQLWWENEDEVLVLGIHYFKTSLFLVIYPALEIWLGIGISEVNSMEYGTRIG